MPASSCGSRTNRLDLRQVFVCAAVFVCFGSLTEVWGQTAPVPSNPSSSSTSKQLSQSPRSHPTPLHIVPFGPPSKRQSQPQATGTEPVLPYWGGPVISNIHVVEVFWGSFIDPGSTTGLQQYFTDVTNSSYFDLLSEYGTLNVTGQGGAPGSNQLIGRGVFDGKYTIAPSVCPGSGTNPPPSCSLTDQQIQNELVNQLSNLPVPVKDSQGNFNSIYLIYFPPGVTITAGNTQSCVGGGFCAYHNSLTTLSEPGLPYGVFPDFGPTSGCRQGCGSSTAFNNLTTASSHEIAEAVTDVDVGSASGYAPPLAWISAQTGQEIGDLCNQEQAQITVGSNTYTVQKLWSNMQNSCTTASAQYQLTSATNVVPGEPFSLTVTVVGPGSSTALPFYDHTVHFTSSDAQAVLPSDYTFVPATDVGFHTFSVTLNSLNNQTITAADTVDPVLTATSTLSVNHNPDLTVALAHSGNFTQGQTGVNYTITVANGGDRPTSAAVNVSDTLPSNLSPTAISGSGWMCTLGTLTCTRSDVLAAGGHYPVVTVTGNVSDTAPPTVVNSATVAGGGEVNTVNDTAVDTTTIVQLGDLFVTSVHNGSFSQGQTAANYLLTVCNVGLGPTSGQVKLVDSLPAGLTATAISGSAWSCTVASLTCTRADVLAAGGSYPPITLTLNVASNAPTSVTNVATVSGGAEVNTANDTASDPTAITAAASDLVIVSTHSGNFTQGQAGAIYNLIVSNVGPLATTGTVTATENPPGYGLTPTAISGSGWNCALSTLSCTRSDVLAAGPGSSYPPITVTIQVAPVAPSSLTNGATVSGGGELDTTNDAASDPTAITPWPDLVMLKSHQDSFAAGQTGVTYTLTVVNNGNAPSFGTVYATDTLPAGLTATDISGTGWTCTLSTLTCMRSDPVSFFYPPITLTANVALNAPSSITNTATVSGGGEIYTADDTATDPTTILPPIFSIALVSGNGTVKAGASATYSFSVTTTATGVINLSCSNLPAKSTCTFQPASVTGSQTVDLSLSTTASTVSSIPVVPADRRFPLYPATLLLLGLAAMTHGWQSKRIRLRPAMGLASLAVLLFLAACGGGSMTPPPPPPPPPNGTPPGTYTVTIIANDTTDQLQGTTTVTLTVQ